MGFALTSISAMMSSTRKSTRSVTRAGANGGVPRGRTTRAKRVKLEAGGRSSGRSGGRYARRWTPARWPHTCTDICERVLVGLNDNFFYLDPLTETCPWRWGSGQSSWYGRSHTDAGKNVIINKKRNAQDNWRKESAQELVEGVVDSEDLARVTKFLNEERQEMFMVDYWKSQNKGRWSMHWLLGQIDYVIREKIEEGRDKLYQGGRYTQVVYQLITGEDRIKREDTMIVKVVAHLQVIRERKEISRMWLVGLDPTGVEMSMNTIRDELDGILGGTQKGRLRLIDYNGSAVNVGAVIIEDSSDDEGETREEVDRITISSDDE